MKALKVLLIIIAGLPLWFILGILVWASVKDPWVAAFVGFVFGGSILSGSALWLLGIRPSC